MAVKHEEPPEHIVVEVKDYALIVLIDLKGCAQVHGASPAQHTPFLLRSVAHQVEQDLIQNYARPEEGG